MIQIKMYPAKNGDAFLIKNNGDHQTVILIDGGYAKTFREYIHVDLVELARQGGVLELVVITHIDSDHIGGLLEFFKQNGNSQSPKIIPVNNVWHNSLRSLMPLVDGQIRPDDNELLNEISGQGYPVFSDADPMEISASQGSSLAALLLGGNYCWNFSDGSQSINSQETPFCELNSEAKLFVIGPNLPKLNKLHSDWIAEMRRLGLVGQIGSNEAFDDAFEFLSAREDLRSAVKTEAAEISGADNLSLGEVYHADDAVPNGSSIALIMQIANSRLLFLGDSWSEDIEAALRAQQNVNFPIIFDAIKVSHHCSNRNTSPSLLRLIDAPVFLISSNGARHNHPDIEVLKEIVDRPSTFTRKLYFNYATTASQKMKSYISSSGTEFEVHEGITDWIAIGVAGQ